MFTPFDPYYKWLGIPKKQRPANHYRLLGIPVFESDPDVISSASAQRKAFLKRFVASEKYGADARRLIQEIDAARGVLLSRDPKATYDKQLNLAGGGHSIAPPVVEGGKRKGSNQKNQPAANDPEEDSGEFSRVIVDFTVSSIDPPSIRLKTASPKRPPTVAPRKKSKISRAHIFGIGGCLVLLLILVLSMSPVKPPLAEQSDSPSAPALRNAPIPQPPPSKSPFDSQEPDVIENPFATEGPDVTENPFATQESDATVISPPLKIIPNLRLSEKTSLPMFSSGEMKKVLHAHFDIPETVVLDLQLLVPDYARASGLQLVPTRKTREWDVITPSLVSPVAHVFVKDRQLTFIWAPESLPNARAALHNSMLQISVGNKTHRMQLREPHIGAEFSFTVLSKTSDPVAGLRISRGGAEQYKEFRVSNLPDSNALEFQAEPLDTTKAPFVRCEFPSPPQGIMHPITWHCGNGDLIHAAVTWKCSPADGMIAIYQSQKYRVRDEWKPLTLPRLEKDWEDILSDYKRLRTAYGKNRSRKLRQRYWDKRNERRQFPVLGEFWKQLSKQPVRYRVFVRAGNYKVVIIQSGLWPHVEADTFADNIPGIRFKTRTREGR